jgi:hypothetical protein
VADDITLNSSTVLNLRYSFTRHYENQGGPPALLSTDITNLGSVNGATVGFPASLAAQEVFKQLPFIIFGDVGGGVGGTADYNNFVYARTSASRPRRPGLTSLTSVLRISPLPVLMGVAITPPHSSV